MCLFCAAQIHVTFGTARTILYINDVATLQTTVEQARSNLPVFSIAIFPYHMKLKRNENKICRNIDMCTLVETKIEPLLL